MRHLLGHVLLGLGLTLLAGLASGCRSTDFARSSSGIPSLRIGTVEDAPPLIFRQKGGWVGLEADLGRALADRLGMKPVFVPLSPPTLSSALLEGKVDILMAGIAISEERRVQMDFSSPYLVVGQVALIRPADILRFNTEIKIRSTRDRVGVVVGTTGDRLVSRYFTNAARVAFNDADDAANALRQGQIDLLIYDAPAALWQSLRHEKQLAIAPALFAREEIAWGFRRGSVALREAANRALSDWQKDGTLESILQRWIPFSK
jgi:ABC-type amino acid transport substrate-binding protein